MKFWKRFCYVVLVLVGIVILVFVGCCDEQVDV